MTKLECAVCCAITALLLSLLFLANAKEQKRLRGEQLDTTTKHIHAVLSQHAQWAENEGEPRAAGAIRHARDFVILEMLFLEDPDELDEGGRIYVE